MPWNMYESNLGLAASVYTNMYTLLQLFSPITDLWAPLVIFFLILLSALISSLPQLGPPG
jgi:hypothetical protein